MDTDDIEPTEGNQTRDLWKLACWEMGREVSATNSSLICIWYCVLLQPAYSSYEKALYASLAGDIKNVSLNTCNVSKSLVLGNRTNLGLLSLPAPWNGFIGGWFDFMELCVIECRLLDLQMDRWRYNELTLSVINPNSLGPFPGLALYMAAVIVGIWISKD